MNKNKEIAMMGRTFISEKLKEIKEQRRKVERAYKELLDEEMRLRIILKEPYLRHKTTSKAMDLKYIDKSKLKGAIFEK